jgi:hypothetical protein
MVSPRGEGIEVRKPQEAARRMYRAVIRGEPASDKLFETKEEAQEYLKNTGKEGVVAGISFKGKSAEELASKETAYRGGLAAEKERASELKYLYATRRDESADRVSRMRQAAEEYDAATTPEGKAAARSKAEDVRLESLREEALRDWERRGLPFETSPFGWDKIQERRKKREEETRVKTEQARAQTRERQAVKAGEESAKRGLSQFDSIIKPLYKASREARRGRDYVTQSNIERRIERFTAGVPTEPKARLRYFNTNEGRDRLNFITEELLREQQQREQEKVIQNWNAS